MTIATDRSGRMFESLVASDVLFLDPARAGNPRDGMGRSPSPDEDQRQNRDPDSHDDRSGASHARNSSTTEGGDAHSGGGQQFEANGRGDDGGKGGGRTDGGDTGGDNSRGDAGGTGANHTDGGGTGGDGRGLGGLLGMLGDGQGVGHDSNLLGDVVATILQAKGAHGSGDVLNNNILHHTGSLDIGPNGLLAPEVGTLNSLINEIHLVMENLGHRFDVNGIIRAITDLGSSTGLGNIGVPGPNGQSDFFTDVLSLPNDVLHGGNPVTDTGHIVADIGTVVGNGHIDHLKDGIFDDLPNPLISVDWSSNNRDSSQRHLIDVDIGQQTNNGLIVNALANPDNGPHHQIEVNVIDVGANGPRLVDADLFNHSDLLHFPALGGAGSDSLAGSVLGGGTQSAGTGSMTPSPSHDPAGGLLGTLGGAPANDDHHHQDAGIAQLVQAPLHHGLGLV